METNIKLNWNEHVFQSLFQFNDKEQLILLNYHIENDTDKDKLESIKILKDIIYHLEKTNGFIFYRFGCNKERFSNNIFSSDFNPCLFSNLKTGCSYIISYRIKFDKKFENVTAIYIVDIEEV